MNMKTNYQFEIDFCEGILNRDSENIEVMELLAGFLTKCGRIDEGLKLDRTIVSLKPNCAISHYNLACSLALKEQYDDALQTLRAAIDRGYDDINWMLNDPDLQGLQDNPGFNDLIAKLQPDT